MALTYWDWVVRRDNTIFWPARGIVVMCAGLCGSTAIKAAAIGAPSENVHLDPRLRYLRNADLAGLGLPIVAIWRDPVERWCAWWRELNRLPSHPFYPDIADLSDLDGVIDWTADNIDRRDFHFHPLRRLYSLGGALLPSRLIHLSALSEAWPEIPPRPPGAPVALTDAQRARLRALYAVDYRLLEALSLS